ncbi:hypothetical protein JMJ77_0004368, partial [Colletotrichum scovillei]
MFVASFPFVFTSTFCLLRKGVRERDTENREHKPRRVVGVDISRARGPGSSSF